MTKAGCIVPLLTDLSGNSLKLVIIIRWTNARSLVDRQGRAPMKYLNKKKHTLLFDSYLHTCVANIMIKGLSRYGKMHAICIFYHILYFM